MATPVSRAVRSLPTYHKRGGAGGFFAAAAALFSCLCLLHPHATHASLAPSELAALLEFKAACRSTVYGASQFLTTWTAVRFCIVILDSIDNISITV